MNKYFDTEMKSVNITAIKEDFVPAGYGINYKYEQNSVRFDVSRMKLNGETLRISKWVSWIELENLRDFYAYYLEHMFCQMIEDLRRADNG